MQQTSDGVDQSNDRERLVMLLERARRVQSVATRESTKQLAAAAEIRWKRMLDSIVST